MRYLKFICGILITGGAYLIMFIQFLFYSDGSIGLKKLIIREFISLIFIFMGLYLIFAKKKKAPKKSNL
jgi:hypothetical protein